MSSDDFRSRGLKACTTCASAKVRCDMAAGQKKCKRCKRLNKECNVQPRGSHSRTRASKGGYGREDLLSLESKVNSVAQRLSSSSQLPTTEGHAKDSLPSAASSDSPLTFIFTQPLSQEAGLIACQLLELYTRQMMPLFPFVWIHSEETPEHLFQERPVLYMAIMVVACQSNLDAQLELAQRWRQEIGRRIWVEGEKSLQLLQGMLVYLAWHHTHVSLGSELSNLMYSAMSLVTELRLGKKQLPNTRIGPGALNEITRESVSQARMTPDEQRCYLGVFWINSVLRMCVRDMVAMPLRPSINESCAVLEEVMQFPSDRYLVQLVRVQQVAETIGKNLFEDANEANLQVSSTMLVTVSHLEKEVMKLGNTLSQGLSQQAFLTMAYSMLQIFLYKVGMHDRLHQASDLTTPSPHVLQSSHLLVSCLTAVKSLIDSFLSLTNSAILSMPYPYWIQVGHSVCIFSRLLATNNSSWNLGILTGISNFTETLERIVCKIEGAISEGMSSAPPRSLPAVFNDLRRRCVEICRKVEKSSRLDIPSSEVVAGSSASGMFDAANMVMDEQTEDLLFNFLTDGGLI
ncbi:hypothetical protein B0T10DRAFT_569285 [Thelonectria olida]|uniref:Zn(2)-C6 fungal-type domain-containing protein n=1 Tax=Thelonectria olida TaxID=1576542 RepID=A0A9P8VPF2_9HYPO|nr:hypothetical protein B0T10DRAFT_569285 [Thelonectria olida]